jgi:hypothetical protein
MIPKNEVRSLLFSSKERPFGHTWQYWTTKWWRWFLSIPKVNSPAMNNGEKNSDPEQSDPNVWFLASTIGGRVERTVRIPSGKAVLFPVINITISNSEDKTMNTDADMISFVQRHMGDIVKKQASIDGEDLFVSEEFRVQSPPFNFSYPPDNIFGAQEGPTRGVGDGYWIFMRPVQEGKHTISTHGSCNSGKIQIIAKIKLIVESNSS